MNPPSSTFFNPKRIGASLKEVSKDYIQTESQDVISRWLHSEQDADLFLWIDEKKNIIKQQLSFHGQVVEWNLIEGVKTGFIFEDDSKTDEGQSPTMDASELIRYDESPQGNTLQQAFELIRHIEALTDIERKKIQDNFKKDPSLGNISPEAFLEKYKNVTPKAPASPNFIQRLLLRIGRWLK